jgi:hypothetical protein
MRGPTFAATALVALALGGVASQASARRQDEYHYPFERVWNTALRMVRVDMRLPVTDRDQDAGYLLFDYVDHGKRFPGSFELVQGERDQRPYVTAVVQVTGMPSYVEQMMLDKLEKKLKAELGDEMLPPPPPPKPQEPKKPEKKPDDETGEEPPAELPGENARDPD